MWSVRGIREEYRTPIAHGEGIPIMVTSMKHAGKQEKSSEEGVQFLYLPPEYRTLKKKIVCDKMTA